MVRETRHLWIGNLPENVREEQILELFQRHGRVQSVKLLSEDNSSPNVGSGGNGVRSLATGSGQRATVSYIDIRSASKALRAGPTLSGQTLQIAYHEPGVVVSSHVNPLSLDSNTSPVRSVSGDSAVTVNSEVSVGSGSNNTSSTIPQPPPGNPVLGYLNPTVTTATNGPGSNSSNNSYRQQRYPMQHGQSEDASSHFYEQGKGFSRGGRGDFHGGRARRENRYLGNRQGFNPDRETRFRNNWYTNENRFVPPVHPEAPEIERTSSVPPVSMNNNEPGTNCSKTLRITDSVPNSISARHLPTKLHQSRSVSESGSSDRGSSVGSRSRSGSRSSVSTSVSSGRSRSPPHHGPSSGQISRGGGGSSTGRFHQNSFSRHRYNRSRLVSRAADSSRTRHSHSSRSPQMGGRSRSSSSSSSPSPHRKVSTAPHSRSRSPSSTKSYSPSRSLNSSLSHHHHHSQSSKNRRAPTSSEIHSSVRIRNLPSRSSDTSLKDGLYHEYKKHGKVSWVRIIGTGPERHAVVCFKSVDHANRAVSLSQDKLFFGCKIQVTPYQGLGRTGGGEEALGGTDDENRSFGEEESSTTTPSRTVFVTGLDPTIPAAELRKTFEQYGDIVDAKVRKTILEGTTCSGIVEFVDIASAIRAQWVRHVFKSRETRITFYRNPITSTLLLDGITGVTEKQISGHCCQFGAISRVVLDPERILALVQFEEISSAQTAFRELKNWFQKGRQLHVDYATPTCTRLFLDRALGTIGSNLRLSPDLRSDSGTPPILSGSTGLPSKNRRSGSRKFNDLPPDRRASYRNSIERVLDDGKAGNELSPESLSNRNVINDFNEPNSVEEAINGRRSARYNGSGEDVAGVGSNHAENSPGSLPSNSGRRSGKVKNHSSSTKIDLSCHETDSAVVTSSSDIICVDKDLTEIENLPYENHLLSIHGGTSALVTVNGDDHQSSSYESVGVVKSRASYRWTSKSQTVFDGVSSTSPEPKTETVHKVSPDSGMSLVTVEPLPPETARETQVSPVLLDPRRQASENKIRRSSADSGNIHYSAFVAVNSNSSGNTSIYTSETIIPDTRRENSDNRPGTPLCDENPETFPGEDEPPQSRESVVGRPAHPYKSNEQPLSSPLPEFIHHRNISCDVLQQSVKLKSYPKPKSPPIPTREESSNASPVAESHTPIVGVSPIPPTSPPSVMPSSVAANERDPSSVSPADEKSLSSSFSSPPPAKSTNVTDNTNGGQGSSGSSCEVPSGRTQLGSTLPYTRTSSPPPTEKDETNSEDGKASDCPLKLREVEEKFSATDEDVLVSPPSSDCEGSPRGEEDLAQRVQDLYQRFDEWDSGNRSVARSYSSSNTTEEGTEFNRLSLHLDKPWLSRSKAIDLEELRSQPSDITKSLIAKKSIFDEDIKRLESLNDTNISSSSLSNWRLSFAARSNSTTSNSSTTSVPPTPNSASSTASSNVFPPPTPTTSGVNNPLSPPQDPRLAGKPTTSSIPVKIPTTSANCITAGGVLLNANNKRKEGGTIGTPLWAPKDPRLALKPQQNQGTPSRIPVASSTQSTSSYSIPAQAQHSASININPPSGKPEPPKPIVDFPKPKYSGEPSSDESHKPTLMTQKSAPPLGIHQGIPRMVERSMSLDCKKLLAPTSPADMHTTPPPPSIPAANPCNSIPATSSTSSSLSSRRISVDTGSLKEGQNSISQQRKEGDASKPKNRGVEGNKESKPKEVRLKTCVPTVQSSVVTNANTAESSKTLAKSEGLQEDVAVNPPQPNVAPVTVQHFSNTPTPICSKTGSTSSSSSGKEKEFNKKEKDPIKKNSRSGNGVGLSNSVANSSINNKVDSSGSNKSNEKEKRGDGNSGEKLKQENSRHGIHHHKEKKKKEVPPAKDKSTANETPNAVIPSTPTFSIQDVKKEKDPKVKRSHSTPEIQPEQKKPKLEKDKSEEKDKEKVREQSSSQQQGNTHQSRTKSVSSSGSLERRESWDSSSSVAKDKKEIQKDKPHSSVKSSQNKGETTSSSLPSTLKKSGKSDSKESHHRSKSTSSSSSRTHSHTKSGKTELSSPVHSHSSTEKQKAEKVSPSGGKEREVTKSVSSSSQNKHSSSHHGSASSRHRKSEKEDKPPSSAKSKSRDREKGISTQYDSDEDSNGEAQHSKNDKPKTSISSIRAEKRDPINTSSGKPRRDRQKSGGDSSSAPCDSHKPGSSGRSKSKEKKKRRSRLIEESDSSTDDDDEERKHHSIFDVVVDEYVSMYDKVKARSNRACKNVASKKQEEEVQKKHDKIQDCFQMLKKSRAKREEKKQSNSIDGRQSFLNTSDDEGSRDSSRDADQDSRRRNQSPVTQRGSLSIITGLCSNSDDEDGDSILKQLKSSKPSKPKSKSSRDGSLKSETTSLKRSKKSSKSSPLRSSAFFLSHSDEDSGPSMKKRKLSSKHKLAAMVVQNRIDANKSSDDESMSETSLPSAKSLSKKKPSFSKTERKSLADIYTESDNSLHSFKDHQKPTPFSSKIRKDKSSKQKSMRHIFESSDSSGDEREKNIIPQKKEKEVSGKSKSMPGSSKESKTNKKKLSHHVHGSSDGSKSSKRKRERLSSEDSKNVTSSGDGALAKRNHPTMEDLLFGPMSNSDDDEPRKVNSHSTEERLIETHTPLPAGSKAKQILQETPCMIPSFKKSKSAKNRSKERKDSPVNESGKSTGNSSPPPINNSPNENSQHVKPNSEKRKKKHHKKSKRLDARDSISHKNELSLDIDPPLFSTHISSLPPKDEPTPISTSPTKVTMFPTTQAVELSNFLSIQQKLISSPEDYGIEEKNGKSMFSSDEDDDDKLKIDITEAIISASGGNEDEDDNPPKRLEPECTLRLMEPLPVIDEATVAAVKLLEEEEKKRNSLVEQDKAIESILMERKSPPRTPVGVLGCIGGLGQLQPQRDLESEYLIKDELKDEASISQEETEDAVAALLKNLGNDDEVDDAIDKRSASPPTIRIIEETTSPAPSFGDHQSGGESDKEIVLGSSSWFNSPVKSPKTLEVEEHEMPSKITGECVLPLMDDSCGSPPRKKKLTCEEASIQLHQVLEMAKQAVAESKKMEEEIVVKSAEQTAEKGKVRSRRGSNESAMEVFGDVYDFHDSDDERTGPAPQAPIPTSAVSPVASNSQALHPKMESKASTPPRTRSPASSGLLELAIERLPLHPPSVPPQVPQQFSPKSRQISPGSLPHNHIPTQQLKPISIDVQPGAVESAQIQSFVSVRQPLKHERESPPRTTPMPIPVVPTLPLFPMMTPNRTPPNTHPRNSIDDTIEDVIRNFQLVDAPNSEIALTQPHHPIPRKGKGRAGNKGLDEVNPTPLGKGRQASPTRRIPAASLTQAPPVDFHVQNQQQQKPHPHSMIETRTESHGPSHPESFLIDPQTGLLTQMAGQTEDGQYVFVAGQDLVKQHHLHAQLPQSSVQSRVAQKAELERAGSMERIAPEQQPYQIQIQKNEGLPAILAQQQQQHILQQQVTEGHRKQHSPSSGHTPPGSHPQARKDSFGHPRSSPPVSSPSFNYGNLRAPTAQSPPTSLPGRLHGMYPITTSQAGYTPMALIRPPQEAQIVRPIRHQLPVGQHVPSPAQIQAQLVRIPQIPIATTITKVDSRNEELQGRKSSLTQPPSTVILTTTSNGPIGINSGMRLPGPHHIQTRTHEGYSPQGPPRIEISGNIIQGAAACSPKGGRGPQQPEAIPQQSTQHRMHHVPFDSTMDDSTSPLDLATPSAHNHSRANNNNNPVAKNLVSSNSNAISSPSPPSHHHHNRQGDVRVLGRVPGLDPQFLGGMSHQGNPYLPYNIPITGTPGQHPYGMRPGSVDSLKPSDAPKQGERPTAHLVPQHLSSPHFGDRGSAESPHLVPMYGSRHPIYNGGNTNLGLAQPHHSPIPSAHQSQRQTFTHPYEFDEGRMYARSPGYPIQLHENREREGVPAGREGSPFVMPPGLPRRSGETPPPAHGMGRYSQHQVLPIPDGPSSLDRQRLVHVQTPPHAPQGPPHGDSLLMLLQFATLCSQRYPIVWQGLLGLKNDSAACQFHFVSGNMNVATDSLPANPDGTTLPLRISQRMRLETVQLDGVARKLQTEQEHCMLLALPCGRDHLDVLQHSNNLQNGFITYLQLKQAAGIVNVHHQSSGDTPSFVIHIFPACEFANENLARIAPDLLHGVADIAHLLIVIATV